MQLTEKTFAFLKIIAATGNSVFFQKGKVQRVIGEGERTIIEVSLEQDLPHSVGIGDLSQFLNLLSLMQNPDLDFQEEQKQIAISDQNGFNVKYREAVHSLVEDFYASDEAIADIDSAKVSVSFDVDELFLAKMIKMAHISELTHISFECIKGALFFRAFKEGQKSTHEIELKLLENSTLQDFPRIIYDVSVLNVNPDNYTVSIVPDLELTKFVSKTKAIRYIIANQIGAKRGN